MNEYYSNWSPDERPAVMYGTRRERDRGREVSDAFHFYTKGEDIQALFPTRKELALIMNIIAFRTLRYDAKVLAFCIMDNHIHIVLQGSLDDCILYFSEVIRVYLIYYNKPHGRCRVASSMLEPSYRRIEDEADLQDTIGYVLRNPINAGIRLTPFYYQWSSAGCYFIDHAAARRTFRKVGSFRNKTEITVSLGTKYTVPNNWLVSEEGYVLPESYVDYSFVESLYGNPGWFLVCIGKNTVFDVNKAILEKGRPASLTIDTARDAARQAAKAMFGVTSINDLSESNKLDLARELRRYHSVSYYVLARTLNMNEKLLKQVFGARGKKVITPLERSDLNSLQE